MSTNVQVRFEDGSDPIAELRVHRLENFPDNRNLDGEGPWPADELGAPREADREETPGPSDCVSSMAARAGFRDVSTVYDYEKNKALRKRRPNPNLIGEGDHVVIPGFRERDAAAPTTTRTTFTVLESQTRLRIRFLGLRKQRYQLTVEGATFRGVVERGGMIDHPIAPTATTGQLVLEATDYDSAQRWELAVGDLDPVSFARGERARLSNLAFPPGSVDAHDEVAAKRAEDAYASWTSAAFDADALARRHDGSA